MKFGTFKEKWVVYLKHGCPFCNDAKNLLLKRKQRLGEERVNIEILDIRTTPAPEVSLNNIKFETYPRIFKNSIFIGGFKDLEKLLSKNE